MPLSTSSDEWKGGSSIDRLTTNLHHNLFNENQEKAYNVKEVAKWVKENYPENLPSQLREGAVDTPIISLVTLALDRLDRRNFVQPRYIEKDGSGEMYYTSINDGLYPTVRINHDVKPRLDDIEDDLSDLEETVDWLYNKNR